MSNNYVLQDIKDLFTENSSLIYSDSFSLYCVMANLLVLGRRIRRKDKRIFIMLIKCNNPNKIQWLPKV